MQSVSHMSLSRIQIRAGLSVESDPANVCSSLSFEATSKRTELDAPRGPQRRRIGIRGRNLGENGDHSSPRQTD